MSVNHFGSFALIGPPGCGKSTLAENFSVNKWLSVVDIDEHILTPKILQNTPKLLWTPEKLRSAVSEKVALLGDAGFLAWEAATTSGLDIESLHRAILSTTGSNPLNPTLMARIRNSMPLIWIDTPEDVIVERLGLKDPATGVGRIIGVQPLIAKGLSPKDALVRVLRHRAHFYKASADLIFTPTHYSTPSETVIEFSEWAEGKNLLYLANNWKNKPNYGMNPEEFQEMLAVGGTN